MRMRHCIAGVLGLWLAAGIAAPASADCAAIAGAFGAAVRAADLEAARDLYDQAWSEPSCDGAFRQQIGRKAALLHVQAAQRRIDARESLATQEPLLRRGLAIGRPWQLLAMLGDLHHERKDFAEAASLYQEALTTIGDPRLTEMAPAVPTIARIHRRAAQNRLLAADYRPVPVHRDGSPGGLAQASIRGFEPEAVPIPITFRFDSTEFTAKGRKAAEDMAGYLNRAGDRRIAIVGHTDERGSESYNRGLSERRAAAVATFLRQNGFAGEIAAIGKGKSEPFQPDDPGRYTQEERWQMDRRVELVR
jgi:outer membrane protein OmpA-like peptidoglycan-associated protein